VRDDPRFRIGLAGLRRVCGGCICGSAMRARRSNKPGRAADRARGTRAPARERTRSWKTDPDALKKLLYESHLLVGDVILGGRIPQIAARKSPADYERAMKVYEEAAQLARAESVARPADEKWRQLYFAGVMNLADTAGFVLTWTRP